MDKLDFLKRCLILLWLSLSSEMTRAETLRVVPDEALVKGDGFYSFRNAIKRAEKDEADSTAKCITV